MSQAIEPDQTTVDIFENDIDMYLTMFCERDGIEDMRQQSQSVWTAALRYIYKHVFVNGVLKQQRLTDNPNAIMTSTYNAYDYDKVLEVLDIYFYDLCMRYDKEASIMGFSALTGIDVSVMYDWGNGSTRLSQKSAEVFKRLRRYREESLSNKLVTGKQNPVGVIATLNHHYGWSSPYTSDANNRRQIAADAALPKLSAGRQQNEVKSLDIADEKDKLQDVVV